MPLGPTAPAQVSKLQKSGPSHSDVEPKRGFPPPPGLQNDRITWRRAFGKKLLSKSAGADGVTRRHLPLPGATITAPQSSLWRALVDLRLCVVYQGSHENRNPCPLSNGRAAGHCFLRLSVGG